MSGRFPPSDQLASLLDELTAANPTEGTRAIPTGFKDVDATLDGGLRPGQVTVAIYAVGDRWQGAAATWRADCRDRFATKTAAGHVREIRDASHYLFLDHRDEVLAAIREFLPSPPEAADRTTPPVDHPSAGASA